MLLLRSQVKENKLALSKDINSEKTTQSATRIASNVNRVKSIQIRNGRDGSSQTKKEKEVNSLIIYNEEQDNYTSFLDNKSKRLKKQ
jgi:hypothetical protein